MHIVFLWVTYFSSLNYYYTLHTLSTSTTSEYQHQPTNRLNWNLTRVYPIPLLNFYVITSLLPFTDCENIENDAVCVCVCACVLVCTLYMLAARWFYFVCKTSIKLLERIKHTKILNTIWKRWASCLVFVHSKKKEQAPTTLMVRFILSAQQSQIMLCSSEGGHASFG